MCSRTNLDLIQRRPWMYLLSVTYSALAAYIHGTERGIYEIMKVLKLETEPPVFQEYEWRWQYYFDLWSQSKYQCGGSLGYLVLLEINNPEISDSERYELFFRYLNEFEEEMKTRGQEPFLQELEEFRAKSRNP